MIFFPSTSPSLCLRNKTNVIPLFAETNTSIQCHDRLEDTYTTQLTFKNDQKHPLKSLVFSHADLRTRIRKGVMLFISMAGVSAFARPLFMPPSLALPDILILFPDCAYNFAHWHCLARTKNGSNFLFLNFYVAPIQPFAFVSLCTSIRLRAMGFSSYSTCMTGPSISFQKIVLNEPPSSFARFNVCSVC